MKIRALGAATSSRRALEARQKYSLFANTTVAAKVQPMAVAFPLEVRHLGHSVGPFRSVRLNILVERDGRAADVALVKSSGFDPYDRAAVVAARNATYRPAIEPACGSTPEWIMRRLSVLSTIVRRATRPIATGTVLKTCSATRLCLAWRLSGVS